MQNNFSGVALSLCERCSEPPSGTDDATPNHFGHLLPSFWTCVYIVFKELRGVLKLPSDTTANHFGHSVAFPQLRETVSEHTVFHSPIRPIPSYPAARPRTVTDYTDSTDCFDRLPAFLAFSPFWTSILYPAFAGDSLRAYCFFISIRPGLSVMSVMSVMSVPFSRPRTATDYTDSTDCRSG